MVHEKDQRFNRALDISQVELREILKFKRNNFKINSHATSHENNNLLLRPLKENFYVDKYLSNHSEWPDNIRGLRGSPPSDALDFSMLPAQEHLAGNI